MTQGIHPLTANMVNQLNRVDTIANNLANQNTVGFKQDQLAEGTFNHYLDKARAKKEEINPFSDVMNTIPKIDTKYLNTQMGSIRSTGNKLDFALADNESFFKISVNGQTQYTKDGSFKSLGGKLVTQNGNEVLDKDNKPIFIDGENEYVKQISVVTTSFNNLDKVGSNNYSAKDTKSVMENENPNSILMQGSLEQSNVNSITSMVSLIEAQRKFEQSQKAITGIDDINKKVIDSIGNGR